MAFTTLTTIPDHFSIMFENSWQLLTQQLDSRLRERVKLVQANGMSYRFNQISATSFAARTRGAATSTAADIAMPARWAFLNTFDNPILVDEFDELFLGAVSNPSSDLMRDQVAAYNRLVDQTIINNALGSATVSNTTSVLAATPGAATTARPFGATDAAPSVDTGVQTVPYDRVGFGGTATASGLTIDKVRYAAFKMNKNEVPSEGRVFVISSAELNDLLATTEVTNTLYNSVRALVDGSLDSFLGFKFVRTELLPTITASATAAQIAAQSGTTAVGTTSGSFRQCFAYQKDAIGLVDGGRKSYLDILPTQQHALQIRATAAVGAARLIDKSVVQVVTDTTKQ